LPDLPGIRDVHKTGLSDAQIEKLKTLSPLSRQNFLEWWKLGESAFVHHYGKDFENHKDFSGYWNGDAYKENVPGKPGQKRLVQNARALIRRDIKKTNQASLPQHRAQVSARVLNRGLLYPMNLPPG